MENQSPLTKSSLPVWVESYPMGYINMKDQGISKFKPHLLKYDYATETTRQIIKNGNNSNITIPSFTTKKIVKTTPLNFENFTLENQFSENFLMQSHMDPIWVIVTFLISFLILFYSTRLI